MRPAAEVDPGVLAVAGPVHGDGLALGQLHYPLGLERLALLLEEVAHLGASPHLADERFVGGDDAPHLLLDRRQLLLGEGAMLSSGREVVVEAVVGRGTEGDLRSRKEVLNRLGEDVRIVVPHQFERIRLIARGDQREARITLERAHDVAHLAVDARGKRGLRQARTNRRSNIGRGRALGHFPDGAVWKRDLEHLGHCSVHLAMPLPPLNRCDKRSISSGGGCAM